MLANLTPGDIGIMDITTVDGNINMSVTTGSGGTTGNINLNPYLAGTGVVSVNSGTGKLNLGTMSFDNGVTRMAISSASSFVPTLSFGGASVGITYGSRICQTFSIGKLCYVNFYIVLSSKGTSTGIASLTMPFTSGSSITSIPMTYSGNLTAAGTNLTTFSSLTLMSSNLTSGAVTPLQDTAFANNTGFIVSGCYITA
jgi:hypothetical protein